MPYLPMNYFPKNQAIEVQGSNPVCFYCLIDSCDYVHQAIIRIYNYITNKMVGIIYLDERGKIFLDAEMDNDNYNNWRQQKDTYYTCIRWSEDENKLPIQGGNDEKSILYVQLPQNEDVFSLLPDKKYTWDIEIFDDNYNIWIAEGFLETNFNDFSTENSSELYIKIQPNDRISVGDVIRTEKGTLKIKTIKNNPFEDSMSASITKNTNKKSIIINGTTYTNFKNINFLKDNFQLPEDLSDMKLKIDLSYYDVFNIENENDTPDSISIESSGFIDIKNKYIYTILEDDIQEGSNFYVEFFRDYQTFQLLEGDSFNDIYNSLLSNDFYEIYSTSIKSTPNYFTTFKTVNINIKTYDKEKIVDLTEDLILENAYHQFFCEIEDDNSNLSVEWSQWKIYDIDNNKIYESEKVFGSNIYLEYYQFFDDIYTIEIIVYFKNNFKISKKRKIYLKHIELENLEILPIINYNNKAIDLSISNIVNNISPIVYDTYLNETYYNNDWYEDYYGNGLSIKENYTALWSLNTPLDFNNFSVKCLLNEMFEGNIIQVDNLIIKIKDNNICLNNGNEETIINIFNEDVPKLLTSEEINLPLPSDNTIPNYTIGDDYSRNITFLNFYDFFNIYFLEIKHRVIENEKSQLTFTFIDKTTNEEKVEKSIILANTIKTFSNLTLYGNITWYKITSEEFNLNFYDLILNFNSNNDYQIPSGFINDSFLIYRKNILDNQELSNYSFITRTKNIVDSHQLVNGISDYGVGGSNKYKYIIMPIYRFNNIYYSIGRIQTLTVETNWFEIGLFGTKSNNGNSYLIDSDEKWYFEVDVNDDSITFNTDRQIQNGGSEMPKVITTQKNYMSGTIKCKLGQIINECIYQNDNIKYLYNFSKFANKNNIKILRLRNNLIIPVNIQLSKANINNKLINTPTEIDFKWTQIDSVLDASIYDNLYLKEDK